MPDTRHYGAGSPGVGKSHLAAALGHAPIDAGYRVLFTRTTDLVQQLQAARQEFRLAATIEKLDKFHLLVLDDLSYVQKSQSETSVLFELINARYERRSLLITANQPVRRLERHLPRPGHDGRGHRPPRPPRHQPGDEHRQLPTPVRRGTRHRSSGPPPENPKTPAKLTWVARLACLERERCWGLRLVGRWRPELAWLGPIAVRAGCHGGSAAVTGAA